MAKYSGLINIVIILAVLYVVFKTGILNSIIGGLKSVGNQVAGSVNGGGGGGGQTQTVSGSNQNGGGGGGGSSNSSTKVTSSNGSYDIDVSGENACACANGVCEGNCSDGAMIDPENFDPFEYVRQNT